MQKTLIGLGYSNVIEAWKPEKRFDELVLGQKAVWLSSMKHCLRMRRLDLLGANLMATIHQETERSTSLRCRLVDMKKTKCV